MKNSVRNPVRKIVKTTGEGSNNIEPTVVNLRTPLEIKEKDIEVRFKKLEGN